MSSYTPCDSFAGRASWLTYVGDWLLRSSRRLTYVGDWLLRSSRRLTYVGDWLLRSSRMKLLGWGLSGTS